MNDAARVCVIIAAKNAASTIDVAIRSALKEPVVGEVVVIDDGSSDDTAGVARRADDGSGRLQIISLAENRGPAAARNRAIEASRSPLIAILDADDFFFPGRFTPMLAESGWDFIADNIAFTGKATDVDEPVHFQPRARAISTVEFLEGNISKPGVRRGEIGFLKPVMRRDFLDEHGIRYNESLRLGEDYDLYLRALIKGARYKVIEHCGYGAVVRADSLSGQHRTEDLYRLCEADRAILQGTDLPPDIAALLRRHERHIRDRYALRAFLDTKKQQGAGAAIVHLLQRPGAFSAVAGGIFRDKTQAMRRARAVEPAPLTGLRYLLPGVPVSQK
ncbi:glycosyltransferase family 2 protein [Rhizobium halophytocola]|uniref:Succinoglycan biosynthesis protein ExoU n=1 Tax=Rhizobium halophytocola TaxID=735519 RepID=A0ABS4E4S1_9HYPH|nr:glycosyltransferase family 2 protein [Rhizobium halophytocola]MBP1852950.1 succinoglycan biosynthesis protein ExoU [Rhizobium halophytocola]